MKFQRNDQVGALGAPDRTYAQRVRLARAALVLIASVLHALAHVSANEQCQMPDSLISNVTASLSVFLAVLATTLPAHHFAKLGRGRMNKEDGDQHN